MLQARAFAKCLRRVSTGRAEMQADIFPSRVLKIRNSPVYRASPALFQLPGLLSRPFHDPSEFEWVQRLHDSTDKILEECFKLKNTKVSDYVVGETEHSPFAELMFVSVDKSPHKKARPFAVFATVIIPAQDTCSMPSTGKPPTGSG